MLYYASQIFEQAGFASGQEAAGVSVLLGAFKLVMTLIAVATVDKLGRRPLLLGGVGGMVVALLLLTAAQGGVDVAAAAGAAGGGVSAAWVSAIALLLYVGCYQISFGPISWLLVGEVFPLAVSGGWGCCGGEGEGALVLLMLARRVEAKRHAECQQSLVAGTCQGTDCNVQQCPPVLVVCWGLEIYLRQQMLVPAVTPWCDSICTGSSLLVCALLALHSKLGTAQRSSPNDLDAQVTACDANPGMCHVMS